MAFSKDNPPDDHDYSPEALAFREANPPPAEKDEEAEQPTPGVTTDHEQHGGAVALTEEQQDEEPGADPAPRHYD